MRFAFTLPFLFDLNRDMRDPKAHRQCVVHRVEPRRVQRRIDQYRHAEEGDEPHAGSRSSAVSEPIGVSSNPPPPFA
jgi:hypothetical protein